MTIEQTMKEIKRIKAKITLSLPLNEREKALWILYGDGK